MKGTLTRQEKPIQVLDPSLIPSIQTLGYLCPSNQELVVGIIHQIAEREDVTVASTVAPGLQTLSEGIDLWLTHLKAIGYSAGTIALYEFNVWSYLDRDPFPTRLSIKKYLAQRLSEVSPTTVKSNRNALRSFFTYLRQALLWSHDPTAQIKAIRVPKRWA